MAPLLLIAACSDTAPAPAFTYQLDSGLRLNHLQTKGTHNSYHLKPPNVDFPDWSYSHAPLPDQLGPEGVRQFELDVHFNPDVPGDFEVFHAPLADPGTTCPLLVDCLGQLKEWSDRNAAHHPLFIFIEPKDRIPPDWADEYFTRLEQTLVAIWPKDRLITPDMVRRDAQDLPTALREYGWPALGAVRQRAMFVMVDRIGERQKRRLYTHGDARLDGRIMFPDSNPDRFDGAVAMYENPRDSAADIRRALLAGLLVWTLADEGVVEARAGDRSRLQAALDSGAHFVSTDYPAPVAGTRYFVEIPGGAPSRCNPVTAPPGCSAAAVEDPAFLEAR